AISDMGNLIQKESADVVVVTCLIDVIQQDESFLVVFNALRLIQKLNPEDAVQVVIDVLLGTHIALYETASPVFLDSDDNLRLRRLAAATLGRIADTRAIIPLMSVLNNRKENYRLRLSAAESLGQLGDEYAVSPLIEILGDERENSVYLKESAAKALGMLGDIRAIEPLIDMLESKKGFRNKFIFLKEQIIEAVGRIGKPSQKASHSLLAALQDEAPSIRLAAIEALAAVGDSGCIPELTTCIQDSNDEIAKEALHAIYQLGGEQAIRDLLKLDTLPRFLKEEGESFLQ
ncbi:MAG: HEAT repeat domain-containing protein, partial [Cyanobacteria bacterium P01_H01_bin.74]